MLRLDLQLSMKKGKMMKSLNVGCGNRTFQDVNVDLYIKDIYDHRNKDCDVLDFKKIPNFVLCDGCFLPFQDNSFEYVVSQQVIEHIENPFLFLKELVRVSSHKIKIETVHKIGERIFASKQERKWQKEHHISHFNPSWFVKAGKKLNIKNVSGYVIHYRIFPNDIVRLIHFPYEIGFDLLKDS